jgi:hypothetical protein
METTIAIFESIKALPLIEQIRLERMINELLMSYLVERSENSLKPIATVLDKSVLPNDITMQEIVSEVNAVRKERYESRIGL